MTVVYQCAQGLLVVVFIYAAVKKLVTFSETAEGMQNIDIPFARISTGAVVVLEFALGIALILDPRDWAIVATFVLFLFVFVNIRNVVRAKGGPCMCFGATSRELGAKGVALDIFWVAVSVLAGGAHAAMYDTAAALAAAALGVGIILAVEIDSGSTSDL